MLISQTKEKQITSLSEIVWKNKITLQIKSEKVRLFLLNVQEYEKQIQETSDLEAKISNYENILRESIDAIQLVRDELKTDQVWNFNHKTNMYFKFKCIVSILFLIFF